MTSTDEETRLGKIGLHDEHCYELLFFQDHDEPLNRNAIFLLFTSFINTSMNVFFLVWAPDFFCATFIDYVLIDGGYLILDEKYNKWVKREQYFGPMCLCLDTSRNQEMDAGVP